MNFQNISFFSRYANLLEMCFLKCPENTLILINKNHQSLSILWLVVFLVNSILNILVIFESCMLQTILVSYYKSL